MFCQNCGNKISDNANFCGSCGCRIIRMQPDTAPEMDEETIENLPGIVVPRDESEWIPEESEVIPDNASTAGNLREPAGQAQKKARPQFSATFQLQRSNLFYISVVLALVQCILPFWNWIEVPVYGSISSFFGGPSDFGSYSLFGYISIMGQPSYGGNSAGMTAVVLLMCFGSLIAIVLNILYVIKGFRQKKGYYKFGKISATLSIVYTVLFLLYGGIVALLLQLIKLTLVPLFALGFAIANEILIGKLKKEEQNSL